jgi:TfoX/Sxy family transcriptional regulator of competence genes
VAYALDQADRVRKALAGQKDVTEKEMFGGLAFLLRGNMCAGVHGEDLIVRVEPARTDALLNEPAAKPFTLSGRPAMPGWLLVAPAGYKSDAALKTWIGRGVAFAGTLAPKRARKGLGRAHR